MSNETPLENLSPRGRVKEWLCREWRQIRRGAYEHVMNHPVVWAEFDFDRYPRAVSIVFDENTLFPNSKGVHSATLAIEIFAKPSGNPDFQVEGLTDEFYTDAEATLNRMLQAKVDGQPLVFRKVEGSDNAIEAFDPVRKVQGLVVMVRIDY